MFVCSFHRWKVQRFWVDYVPKFCEFRIWQKHTQSAHAGEDYFLDVSGDTVYRNADQTPFFLSLELTWHLVQGTSRNTHGLCHTCAPRKLALRSLSRLRLSVPMSCYRPCGTRTSGTRVSVFMNDTLHGVCVLGTYILTLAHTSPEYILMYVVTRMCLEAGGVNMYSKSVVAAFLGRACVHVVWTRHYFHPEKRISVPNNLQAAISNLH